jgi:hypothetical protein
MKATEFREMMRVTADADLMDVCLRSEHVPFICKDAAGWTAFRQAIMGGVDGLAEADIRVVGSARHGFSMRPRNHLRAFTDESDIDVVVVNETLFDWLWIALLIAAYPDCPPTPELAAGTSRDGRSSSPAGSRRLRYTWTGGSSARGPLLWSSSN